MKKSFILLPIVCIGAYLLTTGYSAGPGSSGIERTGASGTGTTCGGAGCHVAIAPAGIVTTVTLMSGATAVTSYTPGASYTIRVSANNPTANVWPRFGYQVSARHASGNAGTMTAPAGSHTTTPTGGVVVCEHFLASLPCTSGTGGSGSTYVVDVPWTAPVAGTGVVTLRAIVNAVNSSSSVTGDYSHNASTTVSEASSTGPAPITGTLSLCVGGTTTLSNATPGGTWSSGTTAVATVISSSGVVTGVAAGTANITYATGTGSVSATVTVNANPAAITGAPAVCPGGTNTLTCTTTGGTWSSSSTATATIGSASGVATGVAAGTTTISYILSTGCYSTMTLTVDAVPPVTGTNTVCVGATTALSHVIPGGTWSSSAPVVGTISSGGVLAGISTGTTTVSYTFGTSGCRATMVVTVIGEPAISGSNIACVGIPKTLTAIPAGGTWSSMDVTKATIVSSTGVVTGVATGAVNIKYKVTTACGTDSTTFPMTVVAAAACPTAINNVVAAEKPILSAFPNPNSGNFSLLLTTPTGQSAHVTITNVLGLKVQEFEMRSNEQKEVLMQQPAGIYYVFADAEGERHMVRVLVK